MTPLAQRIHWTLRGSARSAHRALVLAALLTCAPGVRAQTDRAPSGPALPKAVQAQLKKLGVAPTNIAVAVYPVSGNRPLLAHNSGAALNPASVMKVVTTYAGLDILGPTHTWQTEALADTAINHERLTGPLYLRGNGDPKLVVENFWRLLRELRGQGLRHIDGNLIVDRSAYELPAHDPAQFDGEPLRPYNAGPDPLLLNYGAVRLHLTPDATGQLRVWSEWPDPRLQIANHVTLDTAPCGDWRERLQPAVNGVQVDLRGRFSTECGDKVLNLALFAGNAQIESVFRALWTELGGTFKGQVTSGTAPTTAIVLARQASAPLGELVRDINKFSNNVMARHLFLALSPTSPATLPQARTRLTAWLAAHRIPADGAVFDNGSGLSRDERISADQLRRVLQAAWASPVMPEFIASLPILGRDGTLRRRLTDSPVAGRAHLKTGSLANVRSTAGYLLSQSGQRYVFVALVNDAQAGAVQACIDRLVETLLASDRIVRSC